ncbi:MAG: YrhA family protein [Nonlabens sp.]
MNAQLQDRLTLLLRKIDEPGLELNAQNDDDLIALAQKMLNEASKVITIEGLRIITQINGLDYNGISIYGFTNNNHLSILFQNREWSDVLKDANPEMLKYTFLGESGDDLYVYDDASLTYSVLDRYTGEVVEVFQNPDQLYIYIIDYMMN